MQSRLGLLSNVVRRRFSQATSIEAKYADFVAGRKKKLEKMKVYEHPLEHPDRPINFSPGHQSFMFESLVGPEQVSTHYESFWTSRRYILTGIFSIATLNYLAKISDLNWVLRSIVAGLPVVFGIAVFVFEIPKYQFLPLLNSFYQMTFQNELKMMQDAVPEDIQELVNKNMKEALGQFDFLLLNKKFNAVKEESIKTFLKNQELEVKQSVKERAVDLLKMAEDYETNNQKQLLGKIVHTMDTEVQNLIKSPPKQIVDAAFEAALTGIKEGKMSYKGDAALDYVLKKIRGEIQKFKTLTPEQ